MRRRMKVYCLLAVSILMLIVAVCPHHHHGNLFCLNIESERCALSLDTERDAGHSQGDTNKHDCGMECVTHFSFFSQVDNYTPVTPDYTFYSLIYSLQDILKECFLPDKSQENPFYYFEKLHARQFIVVAGFRAPPAGLCV